MADKLDKDVVNMEWRDGYYTGEISDGVPNGQGTVRMLMVQSMLVDGAKAIYMVRALAFGPMVINISANIKITNTMAQVL